MQAASLLDGLSFDGLPPFKYGRCSAEVDVSRRQVVQALVISAIVVVLDELANAQFELAWQVVVLQQDPVFYLNDDSVRSCLGSSDDKADRGYD